jgi:hypothetical protein
MNTQGGRRVIKERERDPIDRPTDTPPTPTAPTIMASNGPAPKRPRHDGDHLNHADTPVLLSLEPLLFYPQAQEAAAGTAATGAAAAALFPCLKHTDPECHVR